MRDPASGSAADTTAGKAAGGAQAMGGRSGMRFKAGDVRESEIIEEIV
jgi:hypothetical protein